MFPETTIFFTPKIAGFNGSILLREGGYRKGGEEEREGTAG